MGRRLWIGALILFGIGILNWPEIVSAHGVSHRDAAFVRTVTGPAPAPFIYLGAKHMVTGYDHLLFLAGVVFFLYRTGEVVRYVSLFTLGHSVTLLVGVWASVPANAYLIDAVIGLSIVYKGFENIGGFEEVFGRRINTQVAVLVFGLFHGFGLATKLQELRLPANGLFTNLFAFNVGVEVGQGLALMGILIALGYWRSKAGFTRHAFVTNTALMAGGFILMGYQLVGFVVTSAWALK
ncbi:MAG TPA: HupE/UreJ family protein [Vicinamibacterales bacterium]|nr:HupE/UreJ family protein [Vicinamibacterales bacterium]